MAQARVTHRVGEQQHVAPRLHQLGQARAQVERHKVGPACRGSGLGSRCAAGVHQGLALHRVGTAVLDPGSHVINLVTRAGKPEWVYVGMPGHAEDEGKAVDEAVLNRVRMPGAFYKLVRAQLRPGATILVTNSSVGAEPLDKLTIVDAVMPRP